MADYVVEKMREYLGDLRNIQGKSAEAILRAFTASEGVLGEDLEYLSLRLMPMIEEAIAGGVRHE